MTIRQNIQQINALKKRLIHFFFILYGLFYSFAVQAVEVPSGVDFQKITGADLDFFKDEARTYTIEHLPHEKFKPYPKGSPNFGLFDGAVWIRLNLTSKTSRKLFLELKSPLIDSISIYEKTNGGYRLIQKAGDHHVFSDRTINHRYFHTEITLPNEIIIRVSNAGGLFFTPINIATADGIKKRDLNGQFMWGAFLGILIVCLTIIFNVYRSNKNLGNLYFGLYLISAIIVQFCYSGLGFQYVFPNSPMFMNRLFHVVGAYSVFLGVAAIRSFIKDTLGNKSISKLLYFVQVIGLLLAFIITIPSKKAFITATFLGHIYVILSSIFILICSFIAYKRNYKPAIYLMLGLISLLAGTTIFILRNVTIFPDNLFSEYSLQISICTFAAFVTLAIIQGYKDSKMEAMKNLKEMDSLQESEGEKMALEIQKQTQEIENKKEEIAKENDEIKKSMNFAKNIQAHILPSQVDFKSNFDDCFLMYQPKDILSGDFFWHLPLPGENNKNTFAFCIGDCTGHGVPGSMISILALRFLSDAVLDKGLIAPSDILNYVNEDFSNSFLGKEYSTNINDGMDCVVCTFNRDTNILTYSGAINGLHILRNNEVKTYPGNKKSVGGILIIDNKFTETQIQLQSGDRIYLYTDGYSDQFGGPRDKKIKNKSVRKLLLDNQNLAMEEQGNVINNYFQDWKKDGEQTDDVCFFGFKVD